MKITIDEINITPLNCRKVFEGRIFNMSRIEQQQLTGNDMIECSRETYDTITSKLSSDLKFETNGKRVFIYPGTNILVKIK
jgi:hypothetical protein